MLKGGPPELRDLTFELKGVDWYELGVQLKVPTSDLKKIERQNPTEARRLTEVLQYWLDNETASWEMIVEALERIGGHGKIITTIRSKYMTTPRPQTINPTGKLLQQNYYGEALSVVIP